MMEDPVICEFLNDDVCYYSYLTHDGKGSFKFEFYPSDKGYEVNLVSKPKNLNAKRQLKQYKLDASHRTGRKQIVHHSCESFSSLDQACYHAETWAETIWEMRHRNLDNKPNRRFSKQVNTTKTKKQPVSSTEPTLIKMVFTKEAFEGIKSTVGRLKPETGGILMGFRSDYVVRKFIFDKKGSFSPGGYDPNVDYLNPFLKSEWVENRYDLIGFVHSHPRGVCRLSGDWGDGIGDLGYLKRIFEHIKGLKKFLVPIVFSLSDGHPFEILPFIARKDSMEDYKLGIVEIFKKHSSILNQGG
jgi:hypothetical protein